MKGRINSKAKISGVSGLVILAFMLYFNISDKKLDADMNNHFLKTNVYEPVDSDTVFIAATDLPSTVKHVIQTDSLINNLKITTVKKISQKNDDYYDVCFLDTDDLNIMVMYDEDGGVILQ
ncbi:hypothetical protein [Cyclobacterium plantarum]|uniref:Uncharacterized protein n=1 Tax=Cyclobacterium plantarum TaxID=2716263 RepID=A0ABX0HDE6_9BACT|nr:hypothetical protein [Cyclobacterium plantarum]NHE59754.1 hypothetical protein [Cyclobacterium plantarum]